MQTSKLKQITVALCLALMPISAFAVGLGKLNVTSALGEPLKADIELLSATQADLANLTAAIASEEAYAAQGVERLASHGSVQIELAKNASGAPILRLKSNQPITDPFLDMLIQVDWASGRLLREYTVLLDPPGYKGENIESAVTAPVVKPQASKPAKSTPVAKPQPVIAENEEVISGDVIAGDYKTARGDTLAKIAREMKPDDISLEQMLVGLYQANPQAFAGKNMNRLKVGQIMRAPSREALEAISKKQAKKTFRLHTNNWNAYQNKLAGIVAEAKAVEDGVPSQSAAGKIGGAAQDKSVATEVGPKDVVKLSANNAGDSKNASSANDAQAKLAALEEDNLARDKTIKEAQERNAMLEQQIEDMKKLLAAKSDKMAELQTQATAKNTAPVETVAPAEKTTEIKPVEAKPAEEKPIEPVETKPETKPEIKTDSKPVQVPITTEIEQEPGFLQSLIGNIDPTLLTAAGLGIPALLGGWLFMRNKRKSKLASFEDGIVTSSGLSANTVFGNTAGGSVDTGDTSFMTDFSQSASSSMIDTQDVDPIAEAEVYMAYGRDAQAEEILKDAIAKSPKRYELHLKLLEMYAASKNNSGFETIAGELYTTLGAGDTTWLKVAAMGHALEPTNPLYQADSSPTGSGELATKLPEDLNNMDMNLSAGFEGADISAKSDDALAFSTTQTLPIESSVTSTKEAFDFDLDLLQKDLGEAEVTVISPEVNSSLDDKDFGLAFTNTQANGETQDDSLAFSPTQLDAEESFKPIKPVFEAPIFESTLADSHTILITDYQDASTVEPVVEPVVAKIAEESTFDINDIDFNFGEIEKTAIESEAAPVFPDTKQAGELDLSAINLDITDDTPQASSTSSTFANSVLSNFANSDEPLDIETKLDLVKAYVDMGDNDGAKELLQEVLKGGGEKQRKLAQEILATLA